MLEPLDKEITDHVAFAAERARFFIGRTELQQAIREYANGGNNHLLILFSESGAGKSALMACAIEELQRGGPELEVITRFIGAMPSSTDLQTPLKSLCEQLYEVFDYEGQKQRQLETDGEYVVAYVHLIHVGTEVTRTARDEIEEEYTIPDNPLALPFTFRNFLKKIPGDKRLVLFLDAFDQLADDVKGGYLTWFPIELPENVRVIASTLPVPVLSVLHSKLLPVNIVEIKPMSLEEGDMLLDLWLRNAGRKLQPLKRQEILSKFGECGLPLYLKLAFEQARRWKSYSIDTILGFGTPGILRNLFKRLSLESNHVAMMVARSLSYIVTARHG